MLSLCLLLTSTACQSEQDALYSEAVSKQEGQSVAEPSVDPNDPGYEIEGVVCHNLYGDTFDKLYPAVTYRIHDSSLSTA